MKNDLLSPISNVHKSVFKNIYWIKKKNLFRYNCNKINFLRESNIILDNYKDQLINLFS